jgi:surface protein
MFDVCSGLTSLDVSGFNTEKVTDMSSMFNGCSGLTSLDVSNFKTNNVTSMSYMFRGCSGLTSLDVSDFNTEKVTSMSLIFSGCSGLTSLDVSGFNTEKVTKMDYMFYGCSGLTSLDVSGFNTGNVTDMSRMFSGCSGLTSLDVSGFNTEKVTEIFDMFKDCSALTSLDMSGFNTEKVTSMREMFLNCSGLITIYVGSGWNTDAVTKSTDMFNGCTKLVGGAGTVYNADHVDVTYAHIDGGTSNPGYFTDKNKKNVTITAKSCSREYGEANPTFEYSVEGATLSGEPTITCEATATSPVGTYPIVITYTAEDASKMNLTYVDGALTITKAPLTITAKSYTIIQGEPIPTFEVEYTGFKNNETNTVFTTKPTVSTKAKSDTIPGNYDIVVSGAVAANYEMKYVNGILTITDDVTVTAKSYSRVYGDANPTFEFTSEGATLGGTPIITCEATATSPVGTYDIVIAKGSISNSNVTYVNGTLTITKAPLTITAKSCTIKQGKTLPEFELEYSGLKNKETDTVFTKKPTVSTVATSNSEPGTYDITVSGAEAKNYEMKYVNGTLTITERTETLDGIVLTVSEGGNIDDAFESYGGKEEAGKTIAAIIWNASEKLTDKMLEGINNPNLLIYVSEASMAPESTKNLIVDGKAKNIVLVDAEGNNNFFVPQEFTAESISYSRTFKQATQDGISRGWEGIALPFNVQKFIHEEHGEISPFGDSNCDYHFWLRQPTNEGVINALIIEANKPYIISMPNSDEYEPEFNHPGLLKFTSANVTVPVTKVESVWLGDSAQIVPTFQNIEASPDIYVLNVGDSIMDQTEGSIFISNYRSARPFEVYTFHEPRSNETNIFGSRIISLSSLFGGNGTTGVNDAMKTAEPNGETWYDMNGRRLQGKPARKGIYILNGKKVVIK